MNQNPLFPRWSIVLLILLTVMLSFILIANVWVPNLISWDIFLKSLWTYFILVISVAVISKMTDYLYAKKSKDDENS